MKIKITAQIKEALDKLLAPKLNAFLIIDIADELKVADVDIQGETRINAFKVIKLPAQNKKEVILEALRDFIRENNIKHSNAILKVNFESLIIKRLSIPSIPLPEIPDAIRWQLKEEVPFDLSRVALNFTVLKENVKSDRSKTLDIVCVMAKEEEIKSHVLLLKDAGLTCVKASVLSRGYINIMERLKAQAAKEAVALLHLEDNLGLIFIEKNGELEFYRELPVKINQFREALSAKISTGKGTVNLSVDEIEKVLFEGGVPLEGSVYKDRLAETDVMAMLRPSLEHLIQEIKRSLAYYASEFEGEVLKKIFIGGLAAGIPNLDKFLARETGLDLKNISLQGLIKLPPGVSDALFSQNAGMLGLALDLNKGMNLLPYEFRAEKFEALQKLSLRWVAFGISCFLVVSFILGKIGVMSYQKRLDNARIHLNVLSEVKNSRSELEDLKTFAGGIENAQPYTDNILKALSMVSPRQLFLNGLSINFDTKSGSMDGVIEVLKDDPNGVLSQFNADLRASGYFSDTFLDLVEKTDEGQLKFKLNFKLI